MARREQRRNLSGGRLLVALALALGLAPQAAAPQAEPRGRPPASPRLSPVYYDVDARGRLLRVDFERATASVLATLDPDSPSPMLIDLWVLEDAGYVTAPRAAPAAGHALLLYQEPYDIGPAAARLYLLSLADGSLRETSLVLYVAGRGTDAPVIRPLAADWIYVEYTHWPSGEPRRLLFDAARNAVLGAAEAAVGRQDTLTLATDRSLIYQAPRFSPTVRRLDPATGRVAGETDLCAALAGERLDFCAVEAVDGAGRAVVWERSQDLGRVRLHLVRVDGEAIASSEPLAFFYGRFALRERDGEITVLCAEEPSETAPRGRLRHFRVAGDRLAPGEIQEPPARRPLGYTSLLEISTWFYSRLPSRTFPESLRQEVREWGAEFRRLAAERATRAVAEGAARPLEIETEEPGPAPRD